MRRPTGLASCLCSPARACDGESPARRSVERRHALPLPGSDDTHKVNGLDRSWQRPPGLAAKLVDSRASNGLYYIEYTLQNPGDKRRHIVSAVGMAFNGWYNRLYTVTGQYIDDDEESGKYKPQIEKSVKSFKFT